MTSSEGKGQSAKRYLLVALVAGAILYGSLYPFVFHISEIGQSGFLHLLGTWATPPQSRGDLLANILLYAPLGFSIGITRSQARAGQWSWLMALAMGVVLSFSIEWAQFYDEGRVSCLSDFYLNVAGSLLGWLTSRIRYLKPVNVFLPQEGTAIFSRVLLFVWAGWRLFPYAPTIDLHKYWNSLKPVFLTPNLQPYDVVRFTTLWLSVSVLLQNGIQPKSLVRALLPVMLGYFFAKILIVDQVLTLSEICGAGLALLLSYPLLVRRPSIAVPILGCLFLAMVISGRLLPWQMSEIPKQFGWIPFFSFLHSSLRVDLISFAEKFFLYGTLLLLLTKSGLTLGLAAILEFLVLLGTSAVETVLVGRSAEITDAVMVVILALIYWFFRREYGETAAATRKPDRFGNI